MTSPTLKKIAQTLGISVSTASRALKQHPDISAATRQKVLDLAKTLDYEPNANAVQLRTRNSKLFGILVPTIANHFYDSFIASLEEICRKNGYSIIILQSANDPSIEAENLKLFRQNRISGLFACITASTHELSAYQKMDEVDIPVIFFDKVPPEEHLHTVCLADSAAGEMAADTIIRKKKKKVLALFGDPQMSITKKRLNAFTGRMKEKAPGIEVQTIHAISSEEARIKTTAAITDPGNRPDTLFCMSDEILIGVMKALQITGLRTPEDMALIAISNGFIPKLFHPEITYVETSGQKLAEQAFANMQLYLADQLPEGTSIVSSVLVEGGTI
ncbi:MAG: LacI family DNA-binding transcriptional regulator [Chitinophagaceae bacterium]|nr:LacI family DNA-binding transcriptional regulator [Chitinophagaceae bacterium]MCA6454396.1 LacI family DNA-binding transcriptional regulator [Chitinophagaceae bacterium]MCA6458315.1 LacI family DNA-binding transcriptional regulator [Chitinophagaceae bacterium]MCA6464027.1 LacI family DNA-binding transcriptional regulator [Chitinophagaceae bacterium]